MGGAVFPSCCLTWRQTMLEVMKIMGTSFKRSCACTATLSALNATPGHHQPTPPLETPGPSWASLGQSLVESLLLSPGFWCTQGFVCAFQESVSPVLCKFWWIYGGVKDDLLQEGLYHTPVCCTQSPFPCSRPLLTPYLCRRHSNPQRQIWLSLCRVSWYAQGFVWVLWAFLVGMAFDLNMTLPLLPSFWGFSFALGCGVYFFGGIQHSPINASSAVSCNFGLLTGEDEHTFFYFTSYSKYTQSMVFPVVMHGCEKWKWKVTQSCPTHCSPMDYTVHGILQARILEWLAFFFPRGFSQPRDWTQVSCIAGRFFTNWTTAP